MNHGQQEEHFARHGGVHFSTNAPAEEINQFVNSLPADKRDSLYEVLNELGRAGLITFYNDGLLADGEGKIGGSNEC
ncbi:hypothetical protein GCM10011571_03570 [Marinithermofilum abyssi]|uniref:Uncharacterized protein n=1 Tax=Marinithermofilum abyssi TaxID=1571185 RepID=A0A8J2VCE1_9BACL|nr:hypothetical protein [Marinithermofilum abyssi]GGE05738.1 hypothetical protein GCM10011571_03570 [Marinithermofilum abyssi]